MAKTLDDIQESFENVVTMLSQVTNQTLENSDETKTALRNINSQIELLANDDNADLIKVFLAELKKGLEDKHNFISTRFEQIATAFHALQDQVGENLSAAEVKELFDIIATNLSVFSKEVISQKDLLGDIVLQIDAFRQDDTQKQEIIKNISSLKNDLDKFNNGFESLILNMSDSFKSTAEQIDRIDGTQALEGLKKDIENIFLSSNAVLSTLQVIDHKNRELEQVLLSLVTKKDYELTNSKLEELTARNTQLTERVLTLSTKTDLENLSSNVDTAIGVIAALKEVLTKTGEENHGLLIAELENLQKTVSQILSQEDFLKFKDELSKIVSEVVQITSITRSDLLDTNFELKNLALILSALDIKGNFQQMAGIVDGSKDSVNSTIYELSNKISELSDQSTQALKMDLAFSTKGLSEQILSIEHNLKTSAGDNLSNILGDIKTVLEAVSSIKSETHLDNMQNLNVVSEHLQLIKEDVFASQEFMLQNSRENVSTLSSNIQELSTQIDGVKANVIDKAQNNFENISKEIQDISAQINSSQDNLTEVSSSNLGNILSNLQSVVDKIEQSKQETKDDLAQQVTSIKDSIYSLPLIIKENQVGFENEQKTFISENSKSIEELSEKITNLIEGIALKDNPLKEIIGFEAGALKDLINASKEDLSRVSVNVYDELKSNLSALEILIADNSRVYDKTIIDLRDDLEIYLNSIKSNTIDNNIKIENSIKELLDLRAEIQSVSENFASVSANSDEKFSNVTHSINNSFNGILTNITQIEAGLTAKNQENLQHTIFVMEEKFDVVLTLLEGYKTQAGNTNAENKEFIFDAQEKISALKQELSLINTDVVNAINTKVHNIVLGLEPIKEGLDEFFKFDFETILADIKSQIDLSHLLLNTSLKDAGAENKLEIVDKINESFDEFSIKVDTLKSQLLTSAQGNVEVLRTDLGVINGKLERVLGAVEGQDKSVEIIEHINNLEDTVKVLFDNSHLVGNIDSKLNAINESLKESAEQLEAVIQNDMKREIEAGISVLIGQVEASRENLSESSHSNFDKLSDKLEEITQKVEILQLAVVDTDGKIPDYSGVFEDVKQALEEIAQGTIVQKTQLSQELSLASDSIETLKSEILGEMDSIKLQYDYVNNKSTSSLLEKFEDIEQKIEDSQQNYSNSTNTLLSEVKKGLQSEVEQGLEDLRTHLETTFEHKDYSSEIAQVKSELFEKFQEIEGGFAELLSKIKIKNNSSVEFDLIASKYEEAVVELLKGFKEELIAKVDADGERSLAQNKQIADKIEALKNSVIEDVFIKFEEFSIDLGKQGEAFQAVKSDMTALLDDLKASYVELNTNTNASTSKHFEELDEKIELLKFDIQSLNLIEQFKGEKADIINEIAQLKESFVELGLNTSMEVASSLTTLDERIDSLENKIDDIDFKGELSNGFDKINSQLSEKIENFAKSVKNDVDLQSEFEELKSLLGIQQAGVQAQNDVLNSQAQILNVQSDGINAQNELLRSLVKDESLVNIENKLEVLSKLDGLSKAIQISELEDDIKTIFSKIDTKLNENLSSRDNTDVQSELISMKESILECIIQLLSGQNFEQESRDIKDFVAEKAEELSAQIGLLKAELNAQLEGLNNNEDVSAQNKYISNQLEGLKTQFELLQENENSLEQTEQIISQIEGVKSLIVSIPQADNTDVLEQNEQIISKIDDLKSQMLNALQPDNSRVLRQNDEILDQIEEVKIQVNSMPRPDSSEVLTQIEEVKIQIASIPKPDNSEVLGQNEGILEHTEQIITQIDGLKSLIASIPRTDNDDVLAQSEQIISQVEDLKIQILSIPQADNSDVLAQIEEVKDQINAIPKLDNSEILGQNEGILEQTEQIITQIDEIKNQITSLPAADNSDVLAQIEEVKDQINDIPKLDNSEILEQTQEVLSRFEALQSQIKSLQEKEIEFEDNTEEITAEIKNNTDQIKELFNTKSDDVSAQIDYLKEELREKLEILQENDEVSAQNEHISNQIEDLKSLIQALEERETEDNTDVIKKVIEHTSADVKDEIKDFIQDKTGDIVFELDELKAQIKHLQGLDNQDITEEIKDYVSVKAEDIFFQLEELKTRLQSVQDDTDNFDGIKDFVQDRTEDISVQIDSVKNQLELIKDDSSSTEFLSHKIEELKRQLQLMQNGTEGEIVEYMYTMQDLESDIAKIRLEVKQLSRYEKDEQLQRLTQALEGAKNDFEQAHPVNLRSDLNRMKDEMLSISNRTNQLLLSADDTNLTIKDNMDDFKGVITDVAVKLNKFGNTETLSQINKKVDNLNQLMVSNLKSTKVLNDAFVYLGEWVDGTSVALKNMESKFEQQQDKIELLEDKVDEILSISGKSTLTKADMKELLVEMFADKNDDKLTKKVENLERQLLKLNKNVDKLASYVDEE